MTISVNSKSHLKGIYRHYDDGSTPAIGIKRSDNSHNFWNYGNDVAQIESMKEVGSLKAYPCEVEEECSEARKQIAELFGKPISV